MHQFLSYFYVLLALTMLTHCTSKSDASQKLVVKSEAPTTLAVQAKTSMDTITKKEVEDEAPHLTQKEVIKTDEVDASTTDEANFSLDYIMGKFDPSKNSNFTKIERKHASREGMYIRKDVYNAYKKMHAAAKKDGISFTILSATRPFNYQKRIWESKWTGQRKIEQGKDASKSYPDPKERALKILKYSSMPGTSRHHWGTDIDLNNFENSYFEKGKGLKEYKWLSAHAATFGFCQPYSKKDEQRPNGYNEEKWHWTYLPIAKQLTDKAQKELTNEMIKGFKGAETATEIEVVKKYVLGINQSCL